MKCVMTDEKIVLNTETSEEKEIVQKLYDLEFAKEVEECVVAAYKAKDGKTAFNNISTGLKIGCRGMGEVLNELCKVVGNVFIEANVDYFIEIFKMLPDYSPFKIIECMDYLIRFEFVRVFEELTDTHLFNCAYETIKEFEI